MRYQKVEIHDPDMRRGWYVMAAIAALIVVLVIIGAVVGGGRPSKCWSSKDCYNQAQSTNGGPTYDQAKRKGIIGLP
jgi:hypothetical protein